ncbi:MAG: hypothetical protein JWQ09_3808, partial [Segetibacter sp.]|nr:hypothetical protein [Segetibacter sp.]
WNRSAGIDEAELPHARGVRATNEGSEIPGGAIYSEMAIVQHARYSPIAQSLRSDPLWDNRASLKIFSTDIE